MLGPWHRGAFLKQGPQSTNLKRIQIFNCIQIKNFCTAEDVFKKKKKVTTSQRGEKIFTFHIINNRLCVIDTSSVSRIYKELLKIN